MPSEGIRLALKCLHPIYEWLTLPPALPDEVKFQFGIVIPQDLERVTAVKRARTDWETIVADMFDRWGISAPDEAKTISAYLVGQYGRD